MSVSILARRYARAFCELAHEQGDLEEAVESLEVLSEAFEPALDVIFSNPDISVEERHDLVDRAFDAQGDLPRIVYHRGAFGIEPITYVLGATGVEAAELAVELIGSIVQKRF